MANKRRRSGLSGAALDFTETGLVMGVGGAALSNPSIAPYTGGASAALNTQAGFMPALAGAAGAGAALKQLKKMGGSL